VRHAIVLYQDRAPKLVELSRQSWYAPGPQRRLLVEIIEHYKLDLIESHSVATQAAGQGASRGNVLIGSDFAGTATLPQPLW
jgi:hypothetical protein